MNGTFRRSSYGDAVMELDYGVGQILGKLKQLGLDDKHVRFLLIGQRCSDVRTRGRSVTEPNVTHWWLVIVTYAHEEGR